MNHGRYRENLQTPHRQTPGQLVDLNPGPSSLIIIIVLPAHIEKPGQKLPRLKWQLQMNLRPKTILSDITITTLLGWAPPKICKEWEQVPHQSLQQRAGGGDDVSLRCNSLRSIWAAFWCADVKHKTNRIRQIWSHRIVDYVMVQSVQTGPAVPQVLAGRRQGGSQTKRQQLG